MTRDDDKAIGDRTEVVPYDQATRRPAQAPAKRLGRYTLDRIIAQGGMAEIWLAFADGPAGFQKKVVVKRIRPSLIKQALRQQQQDGPGANRTVEMFVREARLLARLEHRNIVQVFELGVQPAKREGDPGEHFIVMEYLEGLTLKDLALRSWDAGQPLPIETVVRIVADACLGLDHAHRMKDEQGKPANLVHRDISPDNLFVSSTGATKLLDFGIAKREDWSNLTQAGELKGKVPYMSPEQLKGLRIDARTDLWAIGVVLYWLLGGRRPFDGPSDIFTMKGILDDAPPPLRELNPNVPPILDDIVRSCLQKEPADRISSAAALHDALSMALLSIPGTAQFERQVEVQTLVAALQSLETPGFEVVPTVAAVPSANWGTLRAPTRTQTPPSPPAPPAIAVNGPGLAAPRPVSVQASGSSAVVPVEAGSSRVRTVAVPIDVSIDADTLLQIDPADIPSTIPPPTQVRVIPITADGPTMQRPAKSLLPLPPVPPPSAPRQPVSSPSSPSSSSSPSPPSSAVVADGPTRPTTRPTWKNAAPVEVRDTIDLSLAQVQAGLRAQASVTLPQPLPMPVLNSTPPSSRLSVVATLLGASVAVVVLGGLAWGFGLLSPADAAPDAGQTVVATVVDAGAVAAPPVDAGAGVVDAGAVVVVVIDAGAVVADAGPTVDAGVVLEAVLEPLADGGIELPVGDIDDGPELEDGGVATTQRPRRRRPPRVRAPAAVGDGFLVVQARPWAKVFIDGLGIGPTPLPALPLPAGRHRLKLEHNGIVKTQNVDVVAQKTTTIQVDMRE